MHASIIMARQQLPTMILVELLLIAQVTAY